MKNAVALGTFDGVHKGHLSVLQIPDNYNKIALIFRIPPKCVKSGVTELLLTPEKKTRKLEDMGFSVLLPVECINGEPKEIASRAHFNRIISEDTDAILVVNVNNYIGNSTTLEIEYAKKLGKEIIYYTDLMKNI